MADVPGNPRMRVRVRVHEVSPHARLRRVITPATPLRGTHLTNVLSWHSGALFSTREGLLQLGALFRLAAVSAHSAVFVPLRNVKADSDTVEGWAEHSGLADLLIVRRDLPLRLSAWPRIRARLRRGPHHGSPATMLTPAPRQPTPDDRWDAARHEMSVAEHAGTVVFTATPRGLHQSGDELTWCGNQVAVNQDIHRYGGPAQLSAFKGPSWRTHRPEDDWECGILAEDSHFQQAWEYRPGGGWARSNSPGFRYSRAVPTSEATDKPAPAIRGDSPDPDPHR